MEESLSDCDIPKEILEYYRRKGEEYLSGKYGYREYPDSTIEGYRRRCNKCGNTESIDYSIGHMRCCAPCSSCKSDVNSKRIRFDFMTYSVDNDRTSYDEITKTSQIPWNCNCLKDYPESEIKKIVNDYVVGEIEMALLRVATDEFWEFISYYKGIVNVADVNRRMDEVKSMLKRNDANSFLAKILEFESRLSSILK